MALQELQIYGLWAAKQSARGTAAAAAFTGGTAHRFRQVAGQFNMPRDDGSENFSDANPMPDVADWVNSLVGNGNPGIQSTPGELAYLLWAFQGGETTTSIVGPPAKTKHTVVPLPGLGHWLTWVTRQGSSVLERMQHVDCQISQVQIEGSTANKMVRTTANIVSLDPGGIFSPLDPTTAMPAAYPFLYTDGTGRFTIDGTTYSGHSAFTLVWNKDLQPVFGDDILVYDLAVGNVVVTISVTLYFDAVSRALWLKNVYGSTVPSAGTKPLKQIGQMGSYSFDLRARDLNGGATGDKMVLTLPKVKWTIPEYPGPNPDGGVPEITLAGAMRKPAAPTAPITIDINNDELAYTV